MRRLVHVRDIIAPMGRSYFELTWQEPGWALEAHRSYHGGFTIPTPIMRTSIERMFYLDDADRAATLRVIETLKQDRVA